MTSFPVRSLATSRLPGRLGDPRETGKQADDITDRSWSLPRSALGGMIQQWTERAEEHLRELDLPSTWHTLLAELSHALASRSA